MDVQTKRLRVLNFKKDSTQIIKILNEWDFLGIMSIALEASVQDEYYDLVNPILNAVYNQATQDELQIIIKNEVFRRYSTKLTDFELKKVTGKIINSWK